MWYRTSVASFFTSRLFLWYRINGFFFSDRSSAMTASVDRCSESWFHESGLVPYSVIRETEVERHEVGVYDEEVCEVLLDGAYNLMIVRFGEAL
jgi:hypothetical protein